MILSYDNIFIYSYAMWNLKSDYWYISKLDNKWNFVKDYNIYSMK